MKFLCIIPARYASTRFPGKPLALLNGKTILQRVWERVSPYFEETIVATDDERIARAVADWGGKFAMTSTNHRSGTDRCGEVLAKMPQNLRPDVVVNVQGDEPFVHPNQLKALRSAFDNPQTQIATLATPISDPSVLHNPNSPKIAVSEQGFALYFSRSVIPYIRGKAQWLGQFPFLKHIGLYAYTADTLEQIVQLPPSPLEIAESLEQLRWLEHGFRIRVKVTPHETIGIDTPEDLQCAQEFLMQLEKTQKENS